MLTLEDAKRINAKHVTEPHLVVHAAAVSAAMGAMAQHFGEDEDHWAAVGYLHDVDYERFPQEHLAHTEELLAGEGVTAEELRAILSHGYGSHTDKEPITSMEKSLFTVDELTGIVMAAAIMRPTGIGGLEVSSLKKKFKDKRFAAKCDRELIKRGCDMLGMTLEDVMDITINGMRERSEELGLRNG